MSTKKTAARPSRSRAEVKEAFEEIADKSRSTEKVDTKTAAAQRSHRAAVAEHVKGITVDSVLADTVQLKVSTAKAVDDITEKLVQKATQLNELNEAIDIKTEELETLHGKDIVLSALDLLIAEHAEKTAVFDAEVAAKRAAWATEESNRKVAQAAADAQLAQDRIREKDVYEYNKQQERRKKDDEFAQKDLIQTRQLADKRAALEAEWAAKSAELEAGRVALEAEKARVTEETTRALNELKKENAIALNAVKRDASDAVKEITAQMNADKKLFEMQISNLTAQLEAKDKHIGVLTAELVDARNSVKDIAKGAIDGASEKSAFNSFLAAQRGDNNGVAQKAGRG